MTYAANHASRVQQSQPATVLMLLTNVYDPDPRVRQQALALIRMGCRVRLLAWDRDCKAPGSERMEGVDVDRVFLTGGSSFVPAVRRIFERRFGADRLDAGNEFVSIANGLATIGLREDIEAWSVEPAASA